MIFGHRTTVLVFVATILFTLPPTGECADDELRLQESREFVAELAASVGPAFECEIEIESIQETPIEAREIARYLVLYRCSGVRCGDAHKVLNYRSERKGIILYRVRRVDRIDEPPVRRGGNLIGQDLIHQVDPPPDR